MSFLEILFTFLTVLSAKEIYISNDRSKCEGALTACDGSIKNPFGKIHSALLFVERNSNLINSEEEGCTLKLVPDIIDNPFLILESEINEPNEFSPFSKIKGIFILNIPPLTLRIWQFF